MSMASGDLVEFAEESEEQDVGSPPSKPFTAVVSGTDWTTETIVGQLAKGNIQLNPNFQRRDAWKRDRKSRFIESLIMGLPIPQIVLAESKRDRGKFIVLDGKQRLLSIAQFWGSAEGDNNAFSLSGLTLRPDLKRLRFRDLKHERKYESDYNSLTNQTIRTVVIRNWPNSDFLHAVFLRLNTGSVNLSPQELRQALKPGKFSDFVDDAAAESSALRRLLGVDQPDPRMRDIEILARFLAFRFFASSYPGRMKKFLDDSFEALNDSWRDRQSLVRAACAEFEEGVIELVRTFENELAKKPGSGQFNRAIFDALIFYHSQPSVRALLKSAAKRNQVRIAYAKLFNEGSRFLESIESDTAGAPHTRDRLKIWGEALSKIAGKRLVVPRIPVASEAMVEPERKGSVKKRAIETIARDLSSPRTGRATAKKSATVSRRRTSKA